MTAATGTGAPGSTAPGARPAPRAGRRPVTALLAATNRRKATSWDERFAAGQGGSTARVSEGTGWTVVSTLIAGLVAYGGVGWLIGHFTHVQILFPIGMAIGLAISLGWVIYAYGRSGTAGPVTGTTVTGTTGPADLERGHGHKGDNE